MQNFLSESPVVYPSAMAVDAMSMSWKDMWGYAYPPHALLPLVLHMIRQDLCEIILIAPLWPEARWFVHLIQLLVAVTRRLPLGRDLLVQNGRLHRDPSNLSLHVFRLSGKPYATRDFRDRLPIALNDLGDHLRIQVAKVRGLVWSEED